MATATATNCFFIFGWGYGNSQPLFFQSTATATATAMATIFFFISCEGTGTFIWRRICEQGRCTETSSTLCGTRHSCFPLKGSRANNNWLGGWEEQSKDFYKFAVLCQPRQSHADAKGAVCLLTTTAYANQSHQMSPFNAPTMINSGAFSPKPPPHRKSLLVDPLAIRLQAS